MTDGAVASVDTPSFPVSEALPRWLPDALRFPRSLWLTLLVGPIVTLAGGLIVSLLVSAALPGLEGPEFPKVHWAILFFANVILSPVVETFFLAGVFALCIRMMRPKTAIVLTVLICAACHSLLAPAWGLVVWWPFLVFVTLYAVWKQVGLASGLAVAMIVHALNNLLPTIGLIASQGTFPNG